ncbi:MAG: GNAT family N-acetyltransferase [Clostridiales bacterium]|nr:GNAT family N-acetyltransferase [Candidatus Apopatocola equi]
MIRFYENPADMLEEHKAVLDAFPLRSGFFYLDAPAMGKTDKRNYAAAVTEGSRTLLCLKPVPYNMMLLGSKELLGELIESLLGGGYEIGSVLCDEETGAAFCACMSAAGQPEYYEALAMDYMECGVLTAPTDEETEPACAEDIYELHDCLVRFAKDCGLEEDMGKPEDIRDYANFRVIRRDGHIVSMARRGKDTDTCMRISAVYTRDAWRGQGLAEKTVNAVKNDILASGYRASLNVDQRNPVTNYLYRKLGFERIFAQGQYRPALVETERLRIRLLTDREMEEVIAAAPSAELKQAYGEMLDLSRENQRDRAFSGIWVMERREDGACVGDLCFKGLQSSVEIGYGTQESYQNRGYMTEAVNAMCEWALSQGSVKAVEAETEPDNAASQRVLEKCGFAPMGILGEEGPRFVRRCTVQEVREGGRS